MTFLPLTIITTFGIQLRNVETPEGSEKGPPPCGCSLETGINLAALHVKLSVFSACLPAYLTYLRPDLDGCIQ